MKRARRVVLDNGLVLLHEKSAGLPIVDLELCLRTGAASDPEGQEGLTRLAWRVWRMGTAALRSREVDQAISALGARLSVEVASSVVRVKGVVIRRNLEPFLALLGTLLRGPAFRARDVAFAKREVLAEFVSFRDSDRALASRAFRRLLFGDHPYGRSLGGTPATLRHLSRELLRDHFASQLVASNCVVGVAGDVGATAVRSLVEKHLAGLRTGRAPRVAVPAPRRIAGRRVILVHRADRPQCDLLIGTLGARLGDEDYDALAVGNVAFGGMMASPLWQEVRERRGWSYSVSSRLGADRQRDAWMMHAVPERDKTVECAALELALLEGWVAHGVSGEAHRLAKQNMIFSHCFEWDTAHKRMEHQIDAEVLPFPIEQLMQHRNRVRAVTRRASSEAVQRRLSPKHLAIVAVGDVARLRKGMAQLAGVTDLSIVPYDRVL